MPVMRKYYILCGPQASGVNIRQIPHAHVTTITCLPQKKEASCIMKQRLATVTTSDHDIHHFILEVLMSNTN